MNMRSVFEIVGVVHKRTTFKPNDSAQSYYGLVLAGLGHSLRVGVEYEVYSQIEEGQKVYVSGRLQPRQGGGVRLVTGQVKILENKKG